VAVVAVVAVVAFPDKFAVMVPAAKLPEASLLTIVDAVFKFVAALARVVADAMFAADWLPTKDTTVAPCVPVTSPERDPVKLVAEVAVDAFPLRLAVMVPAAKLPEPSLFTIVETVLVLVAALARTVAEATLEAVCPPTEATDVADCVPVTSPDKLPVKFVEVVEVVAFPDKLAVMVPAAKLPEASLLTIVDAVLVAVAAFAAVAPRATLAAVTPPTVETTVAD
jgi:hypothetical protein